MLRPGPVTASLFVVLVTLAVAVVLFATERLRADLVAVLVMHWPL